MNKNEVPLFASEFLAVDVNEVVRDLNEKGYYAFPSALTKNAVSTIESDSTKTKINLNSNLIGGVYSEKQYYQTKLLSVSKTFYDFSTSSFVFKVCRQYLGEEFRLKALRYYETYGGHHMQWHTDNKTDRGFAQIPGIIFIFYVEDVEDGEFQYVEGSHLYSGKKAYSDYSDEFIENNYNEEITSFKMPSGSLIIYDTYGIHRAKPVKNKSFVRKSVFFQVDANMENAEPIIVNTEFITEMNNQIYMFLGFGLAGQYDVFPKTKLNSLPLNIGLILIFRNYIFYRLARPIYNNMPSFIKSYINKLRRRYLSN